MTGDKRREVRVQSVNLINFSALDQGNYGGPPEAVLYSLLGMARTKDISASGCLLITSQPVPPDLILTFDLQLADHLIHCKGRITRATETQPDKEWELGVEFIGLDEVAEGAIRVYLEFKDSPPG